MKEKIKKIRKEAYFFINQFDKNAMWFWVALILGIILFAGIVYLGVIYTIQIIKEIPK